MSEAKSWVFEIELEKREVNPRASEAVGGLINLHLAYSCSVLERQENHAVFFPRTTLKDLDMPIITENLLCAALRQNVMLRWCTNVQKIAKSMAMYLHFKFGFTEDFLSGQGPLRPCVHIKLEVMLHDQPQGSVRKFVDPNILDGHDKLIILGKDLRRLSQCCRGDFGQVLMPKSIKAEEDKDTVVMRRVRTSELPADCGDYDCSICFERIDNDKFDVAIQTPCSHIFHEACIGRWLCTNNSCPMCRSSCAVSV